MEFEINSGTEVFTIDNVRIGTSLIQDFDKDHIYISVPLEDGIKKSLKAGVKLKLIYSDETNLYIFESIVNGVKRDNILLYQLNQPEKFEVIQRREDFRLNIVLELKYAKLGPTELMDIGGLDRDEIEERFKDRFKKCLSVDLCGQGIGLLIDEIVEKGDKLLIFVEEPSLDVLLIGNVVHKVKQFRKKAFNYKIGVSFADQSYKTKEKIVKFIFKKMREQLKTRI